MIMIGDPPDDRCAEGCQADALCLDIGQPRCDGVTPVCDVEVQVEPVLDRFGLWNLLEEQRGGCGLGIAYRGTVVPLRTRNAHRGQPRLPCPIASRWWLRNVVQSRQPELRQGLRICTVERDLDRGHHCLSGTGIGSADARLATVLDPHDGSPA